MRKFSQKCVFLSTAETKCCQLENAWHYLFSRENCINTLVGFSVCLQKEIDFFVLSCKCLLRFIVEIKRYRTTTRNIATTVRTFEAVLIKMRFHLREPLKNEVSEQ